jgi:hypothetical protein
MGGDDPEVVRPALSVTSLDRTQRSVAPTQLVCC